MEQKEIYYQALKINNGHLDEIELGASLNIDEASTTKIISRLLSEHKIEYVTNRACSYRIMSKKPKF